MTGIPGERWKVFADGDDVDDIPLWKVLAKIRADDLDEGSKLNAAFLKGIKPRFFWSYNLAIAISSVFGLLAVVFLFGLAAAIRSKSADFFYYGSLLMLAGAIAPHLWRRAYQYGLAVPHAPLALPHSSDPLFDEVLGHLQKVDGPRVYYISRFGKKRIPLNRRQFFGRLRYFLFSEQGNDRAIVMRFPTAMPLPADLYLHREDMERMLAMSAPKRSGGPGRNVKYAYVILFQQLQTLYRDALGLEIYGVFAQGANEYYDDPLLHISKAQNHISLNSLGLPFAQISLIEAAVRKAIRVGTHPRMEIYMDSDLFHSLMFKEYQRKDAWPSALYKQKMTSELGQYYYAACDDLISCLHQP